MRFTLTLSLVIAYASYSPASNAFSSKPNFISNHDLPTTQYPKCAHDKPFHPQNLAPTFRTHHAPPKALCMKPLVAGGIELSGLLYDSTSTALDAWGWTANLGAPAALVGGAVLATLSETRDRMIPEKSDKKWIRVLKLTCRFLLLSSFALEVASIFVSTVTGSVLLGHGAQSTAKSILGYTSPLGLMRHHHEFEYLTIQIGFLQGLMHWLAAVGIDMLIPQENEKASSRKMNMFMASLIGTLISWILAFYNNNLSFYSDYAEMLKRCASLFVKRYIVWPIRPMSLLYVPGFFVTLVLGWRALSSLSEAEE
eukprot:CAMPEP_0194429116 /NCGR_PEP_ID=MMETSP0176-20130528/43724_1 /TAXON_ID=216777 /ORGANISM="Proboscia alata, Strain PI-D3" /LENGTH=310 /DNA_ID=CAMNT_0039241889 /DNA_START=49 /DNA_END=981 /DNA_ORIENTATION=-